MSLYVLRHGLSLTRTGDRVLVECDGRREEIPEPVANVLRRFGGNPVSIDEVVTQLPGPRDRLATLCRRMVDRGWLVSAPSPAADQPLFRFETLAADATPPAFRADLKVVKPARGPFEVEDPLSGKRFQLYDFELSLARMLNGRRNAGQLVEDGVRLGIPVTLDSLSKFVRQLRAYGFLVSDAAAPAVPEGEGSWAPRETWDPAVRELYRSGLRLIRQNKHSEARGYLEALLQMDPRNPEALELMAQVEQAEESEPELELQLSSQVESEVVEAEGRREDLSLVPPAAPVVVAEMNRSETATPAISSTAPLRRGRIAAALLVVSVAGAGLLGWKLLGPQWVQASPPTSVPTASLGVLPPPEPTSVTAPAPPKLEPEPVQLAAQPPPPVDIPIAQIWHPPSGPLVATGTGTLTFMAPEGALVSKGQLIAKVASVRASSSPQQQALERRIEELETLVKQDPVYQEFLNRARSEHRNLSRTKPAVHRLVANTTGLLAHKRAAGQPVHQGEVVAEVLDATLWMLRAEPAEARPPPSHSPPCQIVSEPLQRSARCRFSTQEPWVVMVETHEAPWLEPEQSVTLRIGP